MGWRAAGGFVGEAVGGACARPDSLRDYVRRVRYLRRSGRRVRQ